MSGPRITRRRALLLGASLGLAGCSGARRRGVLDLWSAPVGLEERAFMRICRRFEREHPGITIQNSSGVNEEKLDRAIVAGAAPDLAYLYNEPPLGPLAANHAVLPLDAYYEAERFQDEQFLPGAIQQQRYNGVLYAMPTTRDSRAFYWNPERFHAAGINPTRPPTTTEELLQVAGTLTQRDGSGNVRALGFTLPDDPDLVFAMFGGRSYNVSTRRITADSDANVLALTWLLQICDAQGGIEQVSRCTASFGSDNSSENPLAAGTAASRIDGEWAAIALERYAPRFQYGVGEIPYPGSRPDLKNLGFCDGDIMMIPVGSRQPELAWTFMAWLQRPAQQLTYSMQMDNLPTIRALINSPQLATGSPSRRTTAYILSHIASNAQNTCETPPLPISILYRNTLINAFQRTLYHAVTPLQALRDVQNRMQMDMARYAA
ncbi:MAG: extracellular solute-binding protein [Armatimonadetes bacterium]|nr:extracellular solute-binding protein [Armatimonadota bacterium]MDE2207228.1 extracellular solute-binding protein [Armatimonadota bacterium]